MPLHLAERRSPQQEESGPAGLGQLLPRVRRELRVPKLDAFPDLETAIAELRPSEPVFCLFPAELRRSAARFKGFPGRALYAVKCNPHPSVLGQLYASGIRDFDVASLDEVELIHDLFGKTAGMFFNNPAKTRPAIRSAANEHGIRFFTVDHKGELEKIADEVSRDNDVVVAVRLSTASKSARYALSTKFGAPPEEAVGLLNAVATAGFRCGLSFHVGSQCLSPEAFGTALASCKRVIREAGAPISVLNVGGGFPAPYPGDDPALIEHYFAAIIFGYRGLRMPPGCILVCEPGRSLVATSGSVIAQVLVRKDHAIYLNDGIFGGLQELRHPRERRPVRLFTQDGRPALPPSAFRVFGPTCDSDDVLGAPMMLPGNVAEGDWIEIGMMGAYSLSMRTEFNGFTLKRVIQIGD